MSFESSCAHHIVMFDAKYCVAYRLVKSSRSQRARCWQKQLPS